MTDWTSENTVDADGREEIVGPDDSVNAKRAEPDQAALRIGLNKARSSHRIRSLLLVVVLAAIVLTFRSFCVQVYFIPSGSMRPTLFEQDHVLVNKLLYRISDPMRGDIVVFKAPLAATPEIVSDARAEAGSEGLQGSDFNKYVQSAALANEKDFIKRVIALPSDCVRITSGYVLVDGVQHTRKDMENMLSSYRQPNGPGTVRFYKDKIVVDGTRAVTKSEIAAVLDKPEARIEIHPGALYINGKPLNEPFIAEDSDVPYPLAAPYSVEGRIYDSTPDAYAIVTQKGEAYVKIPAGKLLVMGDNRNDSNDARFWGLLDRRRVLGKAMFIFWPLGRIRIVR